MDLPRILDQMLACAASEYDNHVEDPRVSLDGMLDVGNCCGIPDVESEETDERHDCPETMGSRDK